MAFYPENIPDEVKNLNQWDCYKLEIVDGEKTKVPYNPSTGSRSKSTDPETWVPFNVAKTAYIDLEHYDGICFFITPESGLVFIDLDNSITDGKIEPWAMGIVEQFSSYTEISQSGKGLHILIDGTKPGARCRTAAYPHNIEIYDHARQCCLTGDVLDDHSTIETRQDALDKLYKEIFGEEQPKQATVAPGKSYLSDETVILKARMGTNGAEFEALWKGSLLGYTNPKTGKPDESAADLALMNSLAFYCSGDRSQMERLFSQSQFGQRDKWMDRQDYRDRTINRALEGRTEFYKPKDAPPEPTLRAVSIEDKAETIGVCPITGEVKKVLEIEDKDTGEKKKFLAWVSDCAVHIHTETRAKDDTEFVFVGTGSADKRPVKFALPAGALAEPTKFKAALLNAFGAKNRIGKLTFEMVQRMSLSPRLMQRVEVPAWDGAAPLLPGVGMAGNVEYRLSSKIPAAVYDGDLQAAGDVMRTLLKVHRFAPVLVAAIMGAPAVARWHKNDRFGLGVWGQTGTLKTSTILAAMGIYGIGYLDSPKLKAGRGGATLVASQEIFAAAGFLPQLYDNIKTVDVKDSQTYVAAMHAVLEGEEKARGKKDGGLRESREFLCIPIVTGEVRPQEASTTVRVMNLNWSQPDTKLLGEVQNKAALLPVIGYHWLRFLAETDFVLGKDFEAFRSKKMEEFLGLKYVNPGRLATIYTLLMSIWDLLEASPLGDVFKEVHESFKTALNVAIESQGEAASEETEISRFLSGLEELIASNPGLIQSEDGKKTIAGAVIGKKMPDGMFLLPTETLNELVKIRAFNQQPTIDSITQGLSEKGLLIVGEDKHLKFRMRFNGGRPRGWYIKAEVVPLDKELSPPGGDAKTDINKPRVPTVPASPPKKNKTIFGENLGLSGEPQKQMLELGGDSGDSGTSSIVDRLVDIDFDSKVSVPSSVPTNKITRDISHSECGICPHPRKDDPGLIKFKEKVRVYSDRRTCASCGQHSDDPLVVRGLGGYICEACRRGDEQLTAKLEQADSQTKLAEVQAT